MNENTLHPLTKAQSDFAAENYRLVFSFLKSKGLDADEFHDAVILSYLRAVQIYDERPELRQYRFSTIAYRRMGGAAYKHLQKLNKCRYPVGLQTPRCGDLTYEETLPGEYLMQEQAEQKDLLERAKPMITERQGNVLYLRSMGYSYAEIAQKSGIKVKGVDNALYRTRRKLREVCAA